jgi:hypothetical protein
MSDETENSRRRLIAEAQAMTLSADLAAARARIAALEAELAEAYDERDQFREALMK